MGDSKAGRLELPLELEGGAYWRILPCWTTSSKTPWVILESGNRDDQRIPSLTVVNGYASDFAVDLPTGCWDSSPLEWLARTTNSETEHLLLAAEGIMPNSEIHNTHRVGWLRAAVLGANDGIVSTASLVLGVAAAGTSSKGILVAGIAGLVAGAMSMAAGEYVSVSSQADAERADLDREQKELATRPTQEHKELTGIYVERGLDPGLASNVATQLMAHDALGAHARDELGISDAFTARPIQAALASAITFSVGAALPLVIVLLVPVSALMWVVSGSALLFLALLGSLAAHTVGASMVTAAARVAFWGALAMALTAGVGALFGVGA